MRQIEVLIKVYEVVQTFLIKIKIFQYNYVIKYNFTKNPSLIEII